MALATGLIQPGSKVNLVQKSPKPKVNNVQALKQKLSVLKNTLEWSERLDLTVEMVGYYMVKFKVQIIFLERIGGGWNKSASKRRFRARSTF